jgi:nucleoside-diphosphate-sugar epimerase
VRVLVLGGSGSIGAPVVRELVKRGHEVVALVRSNSAAQKVTRLGARARNGDIKSPHDWIGRLPPLGAVIHVASDFSNAVGDTDRRLLDALLPHLAAQPQKVRFVYTGGCWMFGETCNNLATEASPLRPLPADAWAVAHIQRVLDAPGLDPIVVHPAMVYEPAAGVFSSFARDAMQGRAIRIVAGENVRWPLVHADDLAHLYALVLENGVARQSYIGSAIDGLTVGRIARAFARRFGALDFKAQIVSADEIAAELGEWARGFALDQQLSGEKARRSLRWNPQHLDPEGEIACSA